MAVGSRDAVAVGCGDAVAVGSGDGVAVGSGVTVAAGGWGDGAGARSPARVGAGVLEGAGSFHPRGSS